MKLKLYIVSKVIYIYSFKIIKIYSFNMYIYICYKTIKNNLMAMEQRNAVFVIVVAS